MLVVPKASVPDISVPLALLGAFTAYIAWLLALIVYRRYFHPLAKVPGPFLPSVTYFYKWYHDAIKNGTYYKRIGEMHAKYGIYYFGETFSSANHDQGATADTRIPTYTQVRWCASGRMRYN